MAYEARLESVCCKLARKAGCIPVKLGGYEVSLPDRLFILPSGRVWFVEFKAPEGRLTKGQHYRCTEFERLGHPIAVIRTKDEFNLGLRHALA